MRVLLTCVLFLVFFAPDLCAQRVTGVVVSAETDVPVAGAIIVLLNEEGRTQVGTLSDERGRFTLAAPAPGRYRLKAERIGFETTFSPHLQVAAGEIVEQRLVVSAQAVALEGITVRASARCRARPETGAETHRVWEEARKALTAVALTEQLRSVSFDIRTFERELDRTGRVLSERSSVRQVMNDYPFRSTPGAELVEGGFIQQSGSNLTYHAPDAHVLLSDEFLSGYCFSVRRAAERPGMIGLTFEPMPQRRHVPGVTGTLWLDEHTSELRQLEYRYTTFPAGLHARLAAAPDPSGFGGSLEFERLENGAWIVSAWSIGVPSYPTGSSAAGIRVTGGDIRAIALADRTRERRAAAGAIRGRLLDSDERTPVEGAIVYVSGTQHRATTDAAGEFRLNEVSEGRYLLAVYHPERDIRPDFLPRVEVAVANREEAAVELLLPGLTAQLAPACGAGAREPGALVAGLVRDEGTGVPLAGARVELRPAAGEGPMLHAITDQAGRYHFCDVPRERSYRLSATLAAHRSAERELTVGSEGAVRRDLALDFRSSLRLVGRVLDGETGQPVASARVRILGTEHAALTNAQGRFAFENVPSGEHRVEVTHLAYGSHSQSAVLQRAEAVELTIHLGVQAIAIEGVVATATARGPVGLEDFHRRMTESRGGGVFLDRAAIERRGALRVEQMLAEYGFRVDQNGVMNPRAFSSWGECGPTVYIDGIRVTHSGSATQSPTPGAAGQPSAGAVTPAAARDALRMVNPSLLEGIEIYRGASQIPTELGGTGGGCGVIALWTRRSP